MHRSTTPLCLCLIHLSQWIPKAPCRARESKTAKWDPPATPQSSARQTTYSRRILWCFQGRAAARPRQGRPTRSSKRAISIRPHKSHKHQVPWKLSQLQLKQAQLILQEYCHHLKTPPLTWEPLMEAKAPMPRTYHTKVTKSLKTFPLITSQSQQQPNRVAYPQPKNRAVPSEANKKTWYPTLDCDD
jgi:hypothetical protein